VEPEKESMTGLQLSVVIMVANSLEGKHSELDNMTWRPLFTLVDPVQEAHTNPVYG
jgi:hypothetical protein